MHGGAARSGGAPRHERTNSPNSIPPERVFSVLNDTFEDDMDNSYSDYIELSLQLQYNNRSRGAERQ